MRIELDRPHPGQVRILKERTRFAVVRCGRRFGKTKMGEIDIIPTAVAGEPCGWFAPTYKYLDDPWKDFVRILGPVVTNANKQEKRIELRGGGTVDFWTMDDPNCGRSRKYRKVVIDEAGLVSNLSDIFWTAIRPTLSDLRGECLMLGTPKGRRAIQEFFVRGENGEDGWSAFRGVTRDNPHVPRDEIDEAEKAYRRMGLLHIFQQEYEGIPADDGGNPFGIKSIRSAIAPMSVSQPVAFGVDLAKSEDFTVVVGLDSEGRCCVLERWQSDWGTTMKKVAQIIGSVPATIDSTGVGDPIVERLQSSGANVEGFKFSSQSKQQLMEGLRDDIAERKVTYPDGWLVNELESFEFEYTKHGVRYSAPEGLHDDGVCALALAAKCLRGAAVEDFAFEWVDL